MNSCIIITSYLDSPLKEQVALDLLDFLKDKNLPIIFVGNYKIPESIQEKSDWVLYTKENPKINRAMCVWSQIPYNPEFRVAAVTPDHGYAHLLQAYRGFKLADSLGYDHVIHINYDMRFSNDDFQTILDNIKTDPNLVMWWGNKLNGYATNFYCFNVKDFISMSDEYLHFYANCNPPDIREGWYCEPFFEWMVKKSGVSYKKIELDPENRIQFQHFYLGNYPFKIYGWEEKDICILWFEEKEPNLDEIVFTCEGEIIKANSTSDPKYFTIPFKIGKYCDTEGNFIFELNNGHFSQFRVAPM